MVSAAIISLFDTVLMIMFMLLFVIGCMTVEGMVFVEVSSVGGMAIDGVLMVLVGLC